MTTKMHFDSRIIHDENTRRLFLAFGVTAIFMIIETIGGFSSGSLALLADAGHMLIDTVALLLALLAVHFSYKVPNSHHTFGWLRLTTLAAFVNAITLVIITFLIIWEAIQRLQYLQPVAGITMMVISIAGLIVNLVAFWILYSIGEKNLTLRAATLHVIGDLLGSIGAIVTALIILYTGWTPIDSILSVLVSCLILRSAWTLLKESINELLEGAPISLDISKLKKNLCYSIPEVYDVHHIHIWQVGEKLIMTMHVQLVPSNDHDMILDRIQQFLEYQYKISHTTIQIESQSCNGLDCHINEFCNGSHKKSYVHSHPHSSIIC